VEVKDKQCLKLVELIKAEEDDEVFFFPTVLSDEGTGQGSEIGLEEYDPLYKWYDGYADCNGAGTEEGDATVLSGEVVDQGSEIGRGDRNSEQEDDLFYKWYDDGVNCNGAGFSENCSNEDKSDGGEVDGDESVEAFYLWYDGGDMSNDEDDDKSDEGEENEEGGLLQPFFEETISEADSGSYHTKEKEKGKGGVKEGDGKSDEEEESEECDLQQQFVEETISEADSSAYSSKEKGKGGVKRKFFKEQEWAGSPDFGVKYVEEEPIDGVGYPDAAGDECMSSEGRSKDDEKGDNPDDDSDDDFLEKLVKEEMELYGHRELERFRKFDYLDNKSFIQVSQTCREVLRCMCMR